MSNYVGNVGDKVTLNLILKGEYEYTVHINSWCANIVTVYKMEDNDGNVFVWKTSSSSLKMDRIDSDGTCTPDFVKRGDNFTVKAKIKEHSEYKGTKQTVIERAKVTEIVHTISKTQKMAMEQMESLSGEDFVWRMPYKQYKEHYSDCETVAGSYNMEDRTVSVIVREGRLKNSGVRGKHFKGYEFLIDGKWKCCYRAVSEENAERRCVEDYPNVSVECIRIYR